MRISERLIGKKVLTINKAWIMTYVKDDSADEYFGNPSRIREYQMLFYIGLILMLVGIPSLFFSGNWVILGIVLIFIGLMSLVAGFLGKKEEIKKTGIKRKSTAFGNNALFLGIISVLISSRPYFALIFGVIAIILSVKSIRNGDNECGPAGGIAGAIGVMVNLYVTVLFTFF